MDSDIYNSIIKVLGNEIDFHSHKDNPDWSKEKNEGFKEGLKYCRNLIEGMNVIEVISCE
ncbi:hypothetical protein ACFHWD_03130 [Clostridium sp. MT-14]|uniref:hypothetical protein n=1 Tax=Clostridium sp. MT-14 TaxID=3348360 RepID=UPI0035F2FF2C